LAFGDVKAIARAMRERNSGLPGVRALALELPRRRSLQLSMNLEDPAVTPPAAVFDQLEQLVSERGGQVAETEVIGLVPDQLMVSVAEQRMRLQPGTADRLLSRKLAEFLSKSTHPLPKRGE
jgi:glutamate formiminotransferase